MENVHIYLSGGMAGLSIEDQQKWRNRFRNAITMEQHSKKPVCFSPPNHYAYGTKEYRSEREVMEYDLNALRNSDLVVVNFNVPGSIGTAMELMLAKELRIPVIGYTQGEYIHPWLRECCTRLCESFEELVKYTETFFLE